MMGGGGSYNVGGGHDLDRASLVESERERRTTRTGLKRIRRVIVTVVRSFNLALPLITVSWSLSFTLPCSVLLDVSHLLLACLLLRCTGILIDIILRIFLSSTCTHQIRVVICLYTTYLKQIYRPDTFISNRICAPACRDQHVSEQHLSPPP